MSNPKDRLYRVLVIGATPAGIAATNKLGEIGVPVTLVDPDPDLNQKLSREEWRLSSGVPLNLCAPARTAADSSKSAYPAADSRQHQLAEAHAAGVSRPHQQSRGLHRSGPLHVVRALHGSVSGCVNGRIKAHSIRRQAVSSRSPRHRQATSAPVPGQLPAGGKRTRICGACQSRQVSGSLDLIRRDNILPGICGEGLHPSLRKSPAGGGSRDQLLPSGISSVLLRTTRSSIRGIVKYLRFRPDRNALPLSDPVRPALLQPRIWRATDIRLRFSRRKRWRADCFDTAWGPIGCQERSWTGKSLSFKNWE